MLGITNIDNEKFLLLAILDSSKQRLWRVLAVSLRVIANPSPEILTRVLKSELSLPRQLLVRTCWVGSQIQHITCSSRYHFVFQGVPDDLLEGVDHLEDCTATARAQVPGSNAGVGFAEVVKSCEMAFCEIDDVDIITDCGSVS